VYESLARDLGRALADPSGFRALGARGREWVLRECSLDAFDERLGQLVDLVAVDGLEAAGAR
jgi:hypothetical protein